MKSYGRIALILALVAVSGFAVAKWVGRYYCGSSCTFDMPFASGDTYAFILSEINKDVDSWVDPSGNPNTVSICNGTKCALYKYIKLSGQFRYMGYYYSTWNGVGPSSGGGTPPPVGGGGPIGGGSCSVGTEQRLACTTVGGAGGANGGSNQQCEVVEVDVLIC